MVQKAGPSERKNMRIGQEGRTTGHGQLCDPGHIRVWLSSLASLQGHFTPVPTLLLPLQMNCMTHLASTYCVEHSLRSMPPTTP